MFIFIYTVLGIFPACGDNTEPKISLSCSKLHGPCPRQQSGAIADGGFLFASRKTTGSVHPALLASLYKPTETRHQVDCLAKSDLSLGRQKKGASSPVEAPPTCYTPSGDRTPLRISPAPKCHFLALIFHGLLTATMDERIGKLAHMLNRSLLTAYQVTI